MALLPVSRKKSAALAEAGNGTRTIIDKGTSITGDIATHGNLLIDGELTGDINSEAKVVLGEGSRVYGHLVAKSAVVEGEIKGNIYVSEQLTLKEKAVVHGDIFVLKMHMEPGAKLNGKCIIGQAPKMPQASLSSGKGASGKGNDKKLQLEGTAAVNGTK